MRSYFLQQGAVFTLVQNLKISPNVKQQSTAKNVTWSLHDVMGIIRESTWEFVNMFKDELKDEVCHIFLLAHQIASEVVSRDVVWTDDLARVVRAWGIAALKDKMI